MGQMATYFPVLQTLRICLRVKTFKVITVGLEGQVKGSAFIVMLGLDMSRAF